MRGSGQRSSFRWRRFAEEQLLTEKGRAKVPVGGHKMTQSNFKN